jgi:hypothetical protein
MSTDAPRNDKIPHDSTDLPDDWTTAPANSEAYLQHKSGAALRIEACAPPTQDAWEPGKKFHAVYFVPGEEDRRLRVSAAGSATGQRDHARRIAREHPDGQIDVESYAHFRGV